MGSTYRAAAASSGGRGRGCVPWAWSWLWPCPRRRRRQARPVGDDHVRAQARARHRRGDLERGANDLRRVEDASRDKVDLAGRLDVDAVAGGRLRTRITAIDGSMPALAASWRSGASSAARTTGRAAVPVAPRDRIRRPQQRRPAARNDSVARARPGPPRRVANAMARLLLLGLVSSPTRTVATAPASRADPQAPLLVLVRRTRGRPLGLRLADARRDRSGSPCPPTMVVSSRVAITRSARPSCSTRPTRRALPIPGRAPGRR